MGGHLDQKNPGWVSKGLTNVNICANPGAQLADMLLRDQEIWKIVASVRKDDYITDMCTRVNLRIEKENSKKIF